MQKLERRKQTAIRPRNNSQAHDYFDGSKIVSGVLGRGVSVYLLKEEDDRSMLRLGQATVVESEPAGSPRESDLENRNHKLRKFLVGADGK